MTGLDLFMIGLCGGLILALITVRAGRRRRGK